MKALIGKKLKGTVSGLNATFEVVAIKNILGESVAILECVTYGAPLIKVSISDIEKPVRAYINNAPKGARVMTNQEILDNAPDGATHVMGGNCYCMENTEYDYSEDGYDYLTFRNEDTSGRHRSLADIAKIAELENQWISVEDEMLIVVNDKVLGLEQGE